MSDSLCASFPLLPATPANFLTKSESARLHLRGHPVFVYSTAFGWDFDAFYNREESEVKDAIATHEALVPESISLFLSLYLDLTTHRST